MITELDCDNCYTYKFAMGCLETLPGDGMKLDPERENFAIQPIASRPANLIHIRVTFNSVTRYINVSCMQRDMQTYAREGNPTKAASD